MIVCKNDAVHVGGMYEHCRIGESVEEREDIYQFRTPAVAEPQWGSGEESPGVVAGVLDMFSTAVQPHEPHHIEMWGGFYSRLPEGKYAWENHLCGCLQGVEIQGKLITKSSKTIKGQRVEICFKEHKYKK